MLWRWVYIYSTLKIKIIVLHKYKLPVVAVNTFKCYVPHLMHIEMLQLYDDKRTAIDFCSS